MVMMLIKAGSFPFPGFFQREQVKAGIQQLDRLRQGRRMWAETELLHPLSELVPLESNLNFSS